jgi:D-glycero-alpha-D-manno-heptose 1-phosphate guanylyltransferase
MTSFSEITAVILAGGLGTRLRPAVADRPKVLAEIHGKYFLTFLLDYLIKAGLGYAVLCTGCRGEQIQAAFGNGYGHLRVVYSQETSPLGTAGALRPALPFFKSDTVLVMNGDSVCYADLTAFRTWHEERNAEASLLLTRVNDVQRFGQVVADNEGHILRFEEKNNRSGPGRINAGIYMINKKLIEEIPDGVPVSLEKEIFPSWIGRKFYGFQSEGRFIDIGTPESYSEAEHFFSMDN